MDDAINFRAAQRARDRLALLLDLTNRVASKLNLRDVLREICANIRRVMECDGVAIALPTPEDRNLRVDVLDFPENPTNNRRRLRACGQRDDGGGDKYSKPAKR